MSHPDPQFDPMDREFEGLFPNMAPEIYRSIPRMSYSGLKNLALSAQHYKYFASHPQETTPAMELGTQIHCAVLEPAEFKRKYVSVPANMVGMNKNKTEWKNWVEEVENANREVLKDGVLDVANAVRTDETAGPLLTEGVAEVSAFWKDPDTFVGMKARADFLRNDGRLIDLKTTSVPMDRDAFERKVINDRWHWQAAAYLKGFSRAMNLLRPMTSFINIVVEVKPPYAVHVYELDEAAIERAWTDIQPLLEQYADCVRTGKWPGPTQGIQSAGLPTWAFGADRDLNFLA